MYGGASGGSRGFLSSSDGFAVVLSLLASLDSCAGSTLFSAVLSVAVGGVGDFAALAWGE